MANPSKQVVNRLKVTHFMQSSVDSNGRTIADALAERIPEVSAEAAFEVITGVASYLVRLSRDMERAEQGYTAEQADDPPVRDERDDNAARLSTRLYQIRGAVEAIVGPHAVKTYGLDADLSASSPHNLVVVGRAVVEHLRNEATKKSELGGLTIDTKRLADELEPLVETLNQTLGRLNSEARDLKNALEARDATVVEWIDAYPGVGGLLEACYRLAGRKNLAQAIRPTSRRSEGREVPAEPMDDTPSAEPAAPARPEPADAV